MYHFLLYVNNKLYIYIYTHLFIYLCIYFTDYLKPYIETNTDPTKPKVNPI